MLVWIERAELSEEVFGHPFGLSSQLEEEGGLSDKGATSSLRSTSVDHLLQSEDSSHPSEELHRHPYTSREGCKKPVGDPLRLT